MSGHLHIPVLVLFCFVACVCTRGIAMHEPSVLSHTKKKKKMKHNPIKQFIENFRQIFMQRKTKTKENSKRKPKMHEKIPGH